MSGWIKCSERLPEMKPIYKDGPLSSGAVLTFNGYYASIGSVEETYKKRLRTWKGRYGHTENVTHWQPLPAPPEDL